MMSHTPSVLKYKAFNGSKFVPKCKASEKFLVSTQSTQLKTCQIFYLLTKKLIFNYYWLRAYVTFSHLFNMS
jgi:hypothetical protein